MAAGTPPATLPVLAIPISGAWAATHSETEVMLIVIVIRSTRDETLTGITGALNPASSNRSSVLAAAQLSKRERAACIGCCRVLFRPRKRHSNAGQHASGGISHHAVNFAGLDCVYTNAMRRDATRIETAIRVRMSVLLGRLVVASRQTRTFGDAGNCLDTCAHEMACDYIHRWFEFRGRRIGSLAASSISGTVTGRL